MKYRWLRIKFDKPFDKVNIKDLIEFTKKAMANAMEIPRKILFSEQSKKETIFFDVSEQGNRILAQGGTITGFSLTPNGIEVEGEIPYEKRPKE